jgi:folate-binding protein YgfZ
MYIQINNRSLLKISGNDSESFLQNQLTNDIDKLNYNSVQINAFCQHQGKIISLFWVMKHEDYFLLSFPDDLLDKIKERLQLFIIISDVSIEDVSSQYNQFGLINENDSNAYSINKNLSFLIEFNESEKREFSTDYDEWTKACIDSKIPEVFLSTTEKFVPQMLNLDIDEVGVSFTKGCYPGQEVVARLHYLGEAKRRLFAFTSESEIQIGDSLYCASSKAAKARGDRYKGSGIVVNSVKFNSIFYCLATLDIDLLGCNINLNNKHGPIIKIINNE